MPSALPTLTRRRLLMGALPATLAFGVLAGATACAPAPPAPELADLRAQFERAHADSALATGASVAAGARPQLVAALATVAAERSAHASALADEITRMTAGETPTPSTPTTTTTAAAGGAGVASAPTAEDVAQALRASAADAAQLAARLSGYRAGLLGSIAAACTASYQVALGDPGQAR